MDTSLFYAERFVSNKHYEKLKVFCHHCPVRAECLQEACYNKHEEWGLWGGFVLSQRQQIKRDAKFCGLDWTNIEHVRRFIKSHEPKNGYYQPTLIDKPKDDNEFGV